jgi:hypothetical protein
MSRRKETLVIPGARSDEPGERDNGKTFILTEMDAYSGQNWALRALLALVRGGIQLPEDALNTGWAGLAKYGLTAFLACSYGELEPLLEEMLGQAQYAHVDTKGKPVPPTHIIRGVNCQIEEIKTFLTLHKALFALHAGFSTAAPIPTTG